MPDEFGGVEIDDFGGVVVEEEVSTPKPPRYNDELIAALPERERRQLDIASELAAEQKRGDQLSAEAEDLARQERSISAFAHPFTTIVNTPGRVMAKVGGVEDTYEDVYTKSSTPLIPRPEGTGVMAGIGRVGANVANTLLDPDEIMKLPAAELGVIGKTLFGLTIGKEIPDQVREAIHVWNDPNSTNADKAEAIGNPMVSAAFLGLLSHGNVPKDFSRAEVEGLRTQQMMDKWPDPDLVARNLAAPGTLRPTEVQDFGPPLGPLPPPGVFEAGNVPFDRMQRFGGQQLPEPTILPQRGPLPPIEILDELRTPQELETRGKVSFGAEAPTLLRTAIDSAEQSGLTRSVEAAKEKGATDAIQKQAADEGVLRQERSEVELPGVEQSREIQKPAEVRAAKEVITEADKWSGMTPEQFAQESANLSGKGGFTQAAYDLGAKAATREDVAHLKQLEAKARAEANAQIERLDTDPNVTDADLQVMSILGSKAQFFTEALESAVGVAKNKTKLSSEAVRSAIEKGEPANKQSLPDTFTSTGEAQKWGAANQTPEGIAALEARQAEFKAQRKALMDVGDFGKAADLAPQGTMIREALARAKGDVPTTPLEMDLVSKLETTKTEPISSSLVDWDLFSENLRDNLESFAPARYTGVRNYDLMDVVDRFVEYAKSDSSGKSLDKLVSEFAKVDEATPTQIRQLRAGVKETTSGDVVSKLESLKFDNINKEGQVFSLPHPDAIKAIGKQVWNDALDLAIVAVKAGRSIKDAVELALKHIRKSSKVDEAQVRANLEYVVGEETKAKPTPAPLAPTPKPVPAPTPVPSATLADVYSIFEPSPKASPSIKSRTIKAVEAFRTGFSSSFRPLNKLAEDIAKAYGGTRKDIAGIFEQLKGSSGKAEADVYRFDREVSNAVKGSEKDFNAYVFLRRSLDRLNQDLASGETRRKVSGFTIPQLEAKLKALESKLTREQRSAFGKAADAYQRHMDQALQLQVSSGRMSPEVYRAIKDGNQFYAPFKVMKYIEDTLRPEGSGRRVDTVADYVKSMEGIESPDFKLGDMLAAARQNLTMSRVLAEKNRAMTQIADLASFDTRGDFVRRLKPGADPPAGMDVVNVMEGGEKVHYAVNPDVALAVQTMGPNSGYLLARMAGNLFRAGATTLNVPFQAVNLLFADLPRQALVSKYGIKGARDIVQYPLDLVHSLYSSMSADLFNSKNKLFLDFLDSGAAGATTQAYLTPEALKFKPANGPMRAVDALKSTLNTIPQFANAIEQTSKVLGIKRAMRIEGKTGTQLARDIPEAVTEIRRFSGSPDFGRMGKWTDQYRLNLLHMFLNARIQGAVADIGRLTGRDGAGTAAKTWLKMGTAVGLPTAYLYILNHSKEYGEDYRRRPEQEKRNYWLIPKDSFVTGSNGEKIRDYWRIPKREIAKWIGTMVESGLDFANERDPEALGKWAINTAEDIAPVNIQGKTAQERLESVGASLNPLVKTPLELGTGRDLYRHKNIVPNTMKKASPGQQYTDRTSEVFKKLAEKMPDVSPEVFRSPLMLENMTKNLTAGLFTQFLPRKPVEGRSVLENTPLLQRFQSLPFTDSTEFDDRISVLERESADEQLNRFRIADRFLKDNKGVDIGEIVKKAMSEHGADRKLVDKIGDLWLAEQRGITPQERRIIALPVEQRAKYIMGELQGKTSAEKEALIRDYSIKRILTRDVGRQMLEQGFE